MAHLVVTVVLLFLSCAHAAPAPEPGRPKFAPVKNSALGFGAAGEEGKAHGLIDSKKLVEPSIEAPVDTGNNVPDVTILDNVNTGAAFAANGSEATGVKKNNKIADNSTKEGPSNPKISFAKDSNFGLAVAQQMSKAFGVVQSDKIGKKTIENQADTGKNVPDVTVLDNVNAGAAFAGTGSIASGVMKNTKFADEPKKEAGVPLFGMF